MTVSSNQQLLIPFTSEKIPPRIQSPGSKRITPAEAGVKILNQLLHSSVFQDWLLLSWVKIRYPGFRVKVFTIIAGFRHRQKGHWFLQFFYRVWILLVFHLGHHRCIWQHRLRYWILVFAIIAFYGIGRIWIWFFGSWFWFFFRIGSV